MLKGIEFARRRDWPFLGTCGGFQYAFIEFARNVLGIKDADSAENNSGSKNIIIYPVACAVPDRKGDAPKLSGAVPEIRLRPGSYLQSFYGKNQETVTEEFFCNFEINPDFEWAAMEAGFPVVARGPQGEIRAIESPTHRFFLATLFQPQLSSTEKKPHPDRAGLRASRRRLGQEKTRRQRPGVEVELRTLPSTALESKIPTSRAAY